jgi:hypothetical protein
MLPAEQLFAANDILLIGSEATLDHLIVGFRDRRSIQPRTYASYAMPPASLLANAAAVFIFEVEQHQRYQQLRMACEYQRRYGGIKQTFAFSRCLDAHLAKRVLEDGARFFPL